MSALRIIDVPEPRLGLDLPADLSFEQWEAEGARLSKANHALQWYIGDWWNAGEKFGDERRSDTARRFFGLDYQRVRDIAWVAGKFDLSCRHDNLSFTHHQEAAALERHEAVTVLDRADRENWSVKDVRYVVQKLKTSNDPEAPEERPAAERPHALPQPLEMRELVKAYEMVIEFAEALSKHRPLDRRENDMLSTALSFVDDANADRSACPADFDIIFVEQGRLACEKWYGASRLTVNRWLLERGKRRLIEQRAEFVRHQRDTGIEVQEPTGAEWPIKPDPLHALAVQAADFLRISRYGGWTITADANGWRVGTVHKSSEELIVMAERQGFDRRLALLDAEREEVDS